MIHVYAHIYRAHDLALIRAIGPKNCRDEDLNFIVSIFTLLYTLEFMCEGVHVYALLYHRKVVNVLYTRIHLHLRI